MDFILLLKAVIIGIVEGITEFLPISSTGHMILVGDLINFKNPKAYVDMFEVVIQLGAILAIVVLYRNKIKDSLINFKSFGLKMWTNVMIAFIPAAIVGFLLDDTIKKYLFSSLTVVLALIVGGLLLLYMEKRFRKNSKVHRIEDVTPTQAIKIGLFQCLALWPGMSRSASTIMGGWVSGLDNVAAAEFSFFLALPTMVAASGLDILKAIKDPSISFDTNQIIMLIIGFVVAFIVALVVVDKFIAFLKKKPMKVFALYRVGLGIILLILFITNVINI